jgi:hypothetical protein
MLHTFPPLWNTLFFEAEKNFEGETNVNVVIPPSLGAGKAGRNHYGQVNSPLPTPHGIDIDIDIENLFPKHTYKASL